MLLTCYLSARKNRLGEHPNQKQWLDSCCWSCSHMHQLSCKSPTKPTEKLAIRAPRRSLSSTSSNCCICMAAEQYSSRNGRSPLRRYYLACMQPLPCTACMQGGDAAGAMAWHDRSARGGGPAGRPLDGRRPCIYSRSCGPMLHRSATMCHARTFRPGVMHIL
jgi:hypothetical protein